MNPQIWISLLKQTYRAWRDDGGVRIAAALAFYALFSLAPLAVIGVALAGRYLDARSVGASIPPLIRAIIGAPGMQAIEGIVLEARFNPDAGAIAIVLSIGLVLFGTLRLFQHLKGALNFIWRVSSYRPSSVRGIVWQQFLMFVIILLMGLVLVVLLIATAAITALGRYVTHALPVISPIWYGVNLLVSFGIVTVLIAVIYQVLPDVRIAWREVWIGSAFTAGLFVAGQYLIGLYLSRVGIGSLFGAAGSIIVLLVWVYLSAQIFLLGAEFTQVYARHAGRPILPGERAIALVRHTLVEHQRELDKVEREFEEELTRIREEGQAIRTGKPSPKPHWVGPVINVGGYIATFVTGIVLGILGVKRRLL